MKFFLMNPLFLVFNIIFFVYLSCYLGFLIRFFLTTNTWYILLDLIYIFVVVVVIVVPEGRGGYRVRGEAAEV